MAADPPKKSIIRTHLKKLVSGGGALVVLAVGAVFTGIGQGAIDRLMDAMSPKENPAATTPASTPTATPAKEALTIAVRTDIGNAGDLLALRSKVSDGPIAAMLVSGKPNETWESYLGPNEGAPVGEVVISMVLTGHRATGIRVTNIGVAKLNSETLLSGTSITLITQGEKESIKLTASLEEPRPRILNEGKPYFPDRNLELKAGEQESLKFTMTAKTMLYRWVFVIDYVDETGAPQQVFVNRLGKTFAQASESPASDAFTLSGKATKYGAAWEENHGQPGFHLTKG
ncbi:MAG TPA: hypothetical protein DGT23_31795 [Micromonosporaceae bacterium]|nr:hypothetical protein [Micromonosporaceae bacterium]